MLTTHSTPTDLYWFLADSFQLAQEARNLSPATVAVYRRAVHDLGAWLTAQGMPLAPTALTAEHLRAYLAHLLSKPHPRTGAPCKPTLAATRYNSLRVFFNWLVDEGEIPASPLARVPAPLVPATPPPVLTLDDLRRLLKTCEGKPDFYHRRDEAILRILIDCGLRRQELAELQLADVAFDTDPPALAITAAKGRKPRTVAMGRATTLALRRYLRARVQWPGADQPWLWLGKGGKRFGYWGIYDMVRSRAAEAGLDRTYVHLFRHSFASAWLAAGGSEGDLMALAGWSSRTMLDRYGASARSARARAAHKQFSPGDQL